MTFNEFVQQIKDYESDTFSADSAEMTQDEARIVAEGILKDYVLNQLNGDEICDRLDNYRS